MQRKVYLGGQPTLNLSGWIHMGMMIVGSRKVGVKLSRHDVHTSVIESGIIEGYPDCEDGRAFLFVFTLVMKRFSRRIVAMRKAERRPKAAVTLLISFLWHRTIQTRHGVLPASELAVSREGGLPCRFE